MKNFCNFFLKSFVINFFLSKLFVPSFCTEFTFDLPDNEEECFFEVLAVNASCTFEFQVSCYIQYSISCYIQYSKIKICRF